MHPLYLNLINKTPKEPEIGILTKIADALQLDLIEVMEQAGVLRRRSVTDEDRLRRLSGFLILK